MTYNPFDVISAHPHWTLWTWRRLPRGEKGRWYQSADVMLLDSGLGRVGRRVTAAHEVEHALHGDTPCVTAELEALQEAIRHRDAARKLIDIHDLANAAVAFPDDGHRVADELDVDYDTLAVRMKWLHPAERHYLRRQLAARDGDEVE